MPDQMMKVGQDYGIRRNCAGNFLKHLSSKLFSLGSMGILLNKIYCLYVLSIVLKQPPIVNKESSHKSGLWWLWFKDVCTAAVMGLRTYVCNHRYVSIIFLPNKVDII